MARLILVRGHAFTRTSSYEASSSLPLGNSIRRSQGRTQTSLILSSFFYASFLAVLFYVSATSDPLIGSHARRPRLVVIVCIVCLLLCLPWDAKEAHPEARPC